MFKSVPLKHSLTPARLGQEKKKRSGKGLQFKGTALTLNPGHTWEARHMLQSQFKTKGSPWKILESLGTMFADLRFPGAWRRLSLYPEAGQFRSSRGQASESQEPPQESQVALFNCLSHVKSVSWWPGAKTECPAFNQNTFSY